MSFMRGERVRVTLPPPPSPSFCSVNVDRSCCFTICGGLTPVDVRPIEVGGEERRGEGKGGKEERRRKEGRRVRESNVITFRFRGHVIVLVPDQLMRSGNETSHQYVPFC